MEQYRGPVNCGERNLDLDINCLASGNLRKHTTAPIQCDILHWNWTWRILYFDRWYHFDKRPGSVYSVTCKQLPLQQGACLLRIYVIQSISLRWAINIVLIHIIARYTCVYIFAAIFHWTTVSLVEWCCWYSMCVYVGITDIYL